MAVSVAPAGPESAAPWELLADFEAGRYPFRGPPDEEGPVGHSVAAVPSEFGRRYRLERELGHGAMATVYLARDLLHQREVAVKVIRPDLAPILGPDRFLREIRIASQLSHPHILPLLDSGEVDGQLFYVMPVARGETLRARLDREGQLPLDAALGIVGEVAEALQYAHQRGIIHRDIKPENILLDGGHALVADFGIARVADAPGGSTLSTVGVAIGTPGYMSPEQAAGEPTVDGRTDIYSLGCVLYEMLAGERPFSGPSAQVVARRHLHEKVPALALSRPDLPGWVQGVVEKAMAKTAADRFQTSDLFGSRLEAGRGSNGAASVTTGRSRTVKRLTLVACMTGVALASFWVFRRLGPETHPNRVVVYSFAVPGQSAAAGTGQQVALVIGSVLEHTEPLSWLDGDLLLGTARPVDGPLSASDASRVARRAGARYYVDGAVVNLADSVTVIVRLHDLVGDSILRQESIVGAAASATAPQLALRAVALILPRLLPPGGRVDLSYLTDRNPAAIADWLQGEREYGHSQYQAALEHMQRALLKDPAMGVAALKGAQAAAHLEKYADAGQLLGIALHLDRQLPGRHLALARGLEYYVAGAADSALSAFTAARAADTTWSEPWMWLGETYYHLMPSVVGDLDSLANGSFVGAVRMDPAFAPALFHLAEFAARRGEARRARDLLLAFRSVSPDSDWTFQLDLTVRCAERGPDGIDWTAAVRRASDRVVTVARILGAGGRSLSCSRRALEAVLARDTSTAEPHSWYRWSALKGLNYQLIAEGRQDLAILLRDSALSHGMPAAVALDVPDVLSGAMGMNARAESTMVSLVEPWRLMGPERLWYFALWEHCRGDQPRLDSVAMASRAIADTAGDVVSLLVAESASARLALLVGDTATAVRRLRQIRPANDVARLTYDPMPAAASERLLLAEVLLATGDLEGAIHVAEAFDSPRAMIHLLYLPASLTIRMEAARRLGRTTLRDRYRDRLVALGRSDLLASSSRDTRATRWPAPVILGLSQSYPGPLAAFVSSSAARCRTTAVSLTDSPRSTSDILRGTHVI